MFGCLRLGVFVVFADDQPDLHRRLRVQIHKFKTRILPIRKSQPGIHAHADVFCWFMDGEAVDFAVFGVVPFRLHHETAARQLAKHAGLAAFGIQHQHLRLVRDVHSFKSAAWIRVLHFGRGRHWICSPKALTGSTSMGTSLTFVNADFNSSGMESYFLNHCSARFLSPVASISSNSLARMAIACGIFVKSIAYLPAFASRTMAPCSAR